MYIHECNLDLALEHLKLKAFATPAHRETAKDLLLGNPNITTLDSLIHQVSIVNSLTEEELNTLPIRVARERGLLI